MKKVFLASRFGEFNEIRKKLTEELRNINIQPVNLDDNMAVAQSPIARSLENVRQSDIVIVLLGDTYGAIPEGFSKSITHLEYEEALKNKKNIYVYGIGSLYRNDEILYSKDLNYKKWQEALARKWVFGKYDENEDIEVIVHSIIMDTYKGENKVWLDEDTGLMWQVNIEHWPSNGGKYSWYDRNIPLNDTNKKQEGRYNDWRIPTFEELTTILSEKSYPNKYSNYEETFIKKSLLYSMSMEPGRFWSETTNPHNNKLAFAAYFNRRRPDSKSEKGKKPKTETAYVRCVRLWRYEEIEKAWTKIKDSSDKEDFEFFLKKYTESNSKYVDEVKNMLLELTKMEQEYLNSLSPLEQKLLKLTENNINDSKITILFKAIKEGLFEEEKYEALLKLKEMMQEEGTWKESSDAKRPEKDKKYQRTLEVITLIELNK